METSYNAVDISAPFPEQLPPNFPKMKDGSLILKADQNISHGFVVKILDIVKKCGVKKLIIGTKLK